MNKLRHLQWYHSQPGGQIQEGYYGAAAGKKIFKGSPTRHFLLQVFFTDQFYPDKLSPMSLTPVTKPCSKFSSIP
jgi:hypothetical protein